MEVCTLRESSSLNVTRQAGVTQVPCEEEVSKALASVSANSSSSNSSRSSRRRRAAHRHNIARTRLGWISRCRFAGGRRFRPVRTRRDRIPIPGRGGRGFRARGGRRREGDLLVLDDDSARVFAMALAFLRGGATSDDQQVCASHRRVLCF